MTQKSEDEATFNRAAYSVLLMGLTGALTVFTLFEGRSLVRALLWPGLGWYRWILGFGEVAFVAVLVWLWGRAIRRYSLELKRARELRR